MDSMAEAPAAPRQFDVDANFLSGLPEALRRVLDGAKSVTFPKTREDLLMLAMGGTDSGSFEVSYDVPGTGRVTEATVTKCRNGFAVNYVDPYMRRRDPDCMVIAGSTETDKPRYEERFGSDFTEVRAETYDWLMGQDLVCIAFSLGRLEVEAGYGALLVAPANAGFFIAGLADLQGMISPEQLGPTFKTRSVMYLAPPFRHTRFDGKQVVVHRLENGVHEVFSYNLYPGPSAKKGVYGVLLSIGEEEDWLTLHGSCVQVITPYDNVTTILHEGASGGGKSEMLEYPHRDKEGLLEIGRSVVTGEKRHILLNQACRLRPVSDDMAMADASIQTNDGLLAVRDAEEGWFVRLDHIKQYGTDPNLERLTIHAEEPLIFLNLDGVEDGTCLIWDHIEDEPGKPCPNPRVILPRRLVPEAVNGTVRVIMRSFGIRTPPCTAEHPTYGIVGYLHVLPSALAWLWRLVAPRGHANPSVTDTAGMTSEGVGSYWPFATGKMIRHANLLLRQIITTPRVRYTLVPNQHVGAWQTGFMPQWIVREYMARRGFARFRKDQLAPSRCRLLGYALNSMQVEGTFLAPWLLRVEEQEEVGVAAYDEGARLLEEFFKSELQQYNRPELDARGRAILGCFLDGGTISDFEQLLPEVEPAWEE